MNTSYVRASSPIGDLFLFARAGALCGVAFEELGERQVNLQRAEYETAPILEEARRQLSEYFSGARRSFVLPLSLSGTEFQKRVWNALAEIPYSETRSYKQQAAMIGSAKAVRAVGRANGANPIAVILPCHRVIGSDRSLTGYGGGLDRKVYLLELERFRETASAAKLSGVSSFC